LFLLSCYCQAALPQKNAKRNANDMLLGQLLPSALDAKQRDSIADHPTGINVLLPSTQTQ
jgi:hypothetical protein